MKRQRLSRIPLALPLLLALGGATAAAQPAGVTLYSGKHLTGHQETFLGDVPDLGQTPFGSDRASSISVAPGCVAILYEKTHYRGRSTTFREVDNDLGNTFVGDDRASSLQVRCERSDVRGRDLEGDRGGPHARPGQRPGVTLFRDRNLRGPSQTFYEDVPDLARTRLGTDRASSIGVPPGCVAVLYQFPHYRGRSTTFRDNDNNLRNTPVGEDSVSSMKIHCGSEEGMEHMSPPARSSGPGGAYRNYPLSRSQPHRPSRDLLRGHAGSLADLHRFPNGLLDRRAARLHRHPLRVPPLPGPLHDVSRQ